MAGDNEQPTRTSSASTLDGGRREGFKEKHREDVPDVDHTEDQIPLPSEMNDEKERQAALGRMDRNALNAMLENPLAGKSREAVMNDARKFARDNGMGEDEDLFAKAALVAQRPNDFENIPELTDEDKAALRFEITHKWRQPFTLYWLVGRRLLPGFANSSDVQYGCSCARNG